MKPLIFICCLLVAGYGVLAQDTINVPGSSSLTIQDGINLANPGDIVLVSDGTYNEQINFMGKPITVASKYLTDGDPSHIDNTIIDGEGIEYPDPDSCSLVYFINDEDTTSVLCGFTIRHGKGTHFADTYTIWSGGAIFLSDAGARITYNHITENHLSDTIFGAATQLAHGAGIVEYGNDEIDHWLIIDHNVIDHNSLYSENLQALGAGFWIDNTNAIISNNVISENSSTATGNSSAVAAGFGLHCLNSEIMTVRVQFNEFKNNVSLGTGNAWASTAVAGIQNIRCILEGNLIEHNTTDADNNISSKGGVIAIYDPIPGTLISNNIFRDNFTDADGGGFTLWEHQSTADQETVIIENNYFFDNEGLHGGGIYTFNIPVLLQNNIFAGNYAEMNGGAAYFKREQPSNNPHLATLINNTFTGNMAGEYGGAIYSVYGDPLIINSIFWNDSCNQLGDEIFLQVVDSAEITYTDINTNKIEGNGYWYYGSGNINEDPLFIDPEMPLIGEGSPCINAGIDSFTCACGVTNNSPEYDILGSERPIGDLFDMGACEWYLGVGISSTNIYRLNSAIYPNPLVSSTTISYMLDQGSVVTLNVFNCSGQVVGTLVNGWQQAGEHKVIFDAEHLPAGLYFYRIEAGKMRGSGKMLVER